MQFQSKYQVILWCQQADSKVYMEGQEIQNSECSIQEEQTWRTYITRL